MTDCIEPVHPVEDEINIHVDEIQRPRVANPVAIKTQTQRPVEIWEDLSSVSKATVRDLVSRHIAQEEHPMEYEEENIKSTSVYSTSQMPEKSVVDSVLENREDVIEKTRLSQLLKQFDLHHDVVKLANAGIERLSDLTYLDQELIKDLPYLTPICKVKLGKLIASFDSAKRVLAVSPVPPINTNDIRALESLDHSLQSLAGEQELLCGNGCFGASAQVTHWSFKHACMHACIYTHTQTHTHACMHA